ncbi:MAG: CAP domain-containing protein [Vicinamibacterales bacterium]
MTSACFGPPREGGGAGPAASADPTQTVTAADFAFCLSETNRYRALAGVSPVEHDPAVEVYAQTAAAADHATGRAHGYTSGPDRPTGAFAENEAVRWGVTDAVRDVVAAAIAAFWREGPGGGHYENLRGPWGRVGCGIVAADGAVTLVQHFRP